MQTEIHTFAEWGYPFCAEDYMGEFDYSREDSKNFLIGGAVMEKGDNLDELIKFVEGLIKDEIEVIMIELCHIHNTILEQDIVKYLIPIMECNKYLDLQSYEHRLAFGRFYFK